jgi:4a-hydroxytetrahydrobiopterin dehydratase
MTAPVLSDDEIAARLLGTSWNRDGDEIVRDVKLENFASAIMLVDQLAEVAEAYNHHPDILVHGWNKVKLSLSTHASGGLTELDFDVAKQFDDVIQIVAASS